jgi:hypothetical protein
MATPRLPSDVLAHLLRGWIAAGPWHAVARLVCRRWRRLLSPRFPALQPHAPWCAIAAERSEALLHWARTAGIPWSSDVFASLLENANFAPVRWLLHRAPDLCALSVADRRTVAAAVVRGGPGALERYIAADTDVRELAV